MAKELINTSPVICPHGCTCSCHRSEGGRTVHMVAYCVRCPCCQRNIKEYLLRVHLKECDHVDPDEFDLQEG